MTYMGIELTCPWAKIHAFSSAVLWLNICSIDIKEAILLLALSNSLDCHLWYSV